MAKLNLDIKYLKHELVIAGKQLQGIMIVRYLTSGEYICDDNLKQSLKNLALAPIAKNGGEYFLEEYINQFSEYYPRKNKLILSDYLFNRSFGAVLGIIPNLDSERIRNGIDPVRFLNIDMRKEINAISGNFMEESKLNENINEILESLVGENSLFNVLIDFLSTYDDCLKFQRIDDSGYLTPERKDYFFQIIPISHKLMLLKYLIIIKILKDNSSDSIDLYKKLFNCALVPTKEIEINYYINMMIKNMSTYNHSSIENIKLIKDKIENIKMFR